ncbi:MAG: prepilin-type N-terminal cleavage/methylation domain-containing protein [Deltaproteobacteria bacterium]|nr:prepilin-type N-terminal cleavage/methylation domain-containing protein [Deltaproteobacteria bacterium]
MARRRQALGFTLVELMATVAILAVLVLVTIPPVLRAVQRREGINAAQTILDTVEFAKVQASARNRAFQVAWTLSTGDLSQNGEVRVLEGVTSACTAFATTPERTVDLKVDYQSIHLSSIQPIGLTAFCIRPDGRVLDMSGQPIASSDAEYRAGDVHMVLRRYVGVNQEEGPRHHVVVPFNGAARIAFEEVPD